MATVIIGLAVSTAASFAVQALTPKPTIDSGSLADVSVPKSNYGVSIPQGWGMVGVAGNLLWATEKVEVTEKKKQGKGGGQTVKERTYFGNFAILLAYCPHRPVNSIKRLWFNNKLVFDADDVSEEETESQKFKNKYLRFYYGDELQQPDPLLKLLPPIQAYDYGLPHDSEAREAALTDLGLDPNLEHIPAYRNKCYVVVENMPLTDYNNQIPTVKAEIEFNPNNTLDIIIDDICKQVGLDASEYDLSGILNIPVTGFYIDRIAPATEAIKTLQEAYFFDIFNSGGKLKFVSQSASREIVNIPISDLAAHGDRERPDNFTEYFPTEEDLPSAVEVNFLDANADYNTGNVLARSQIGDNNRIENYKFSLVLTDADAQAIADRQLYRFYLEARKFAFTLPQKYAYLEVGDRLKINFHGETETVELTKIQQGANLLLKCEAKLVDFAAIAASNISSGGFESTVKSQSVITSQGNTNLQILDINLISDTDPDFTFYATANGGENWRNCSIYTSVDGGNYYLIGSLESPGTIGTLTNGFDITATEFEVILESGEFESVSTADVDNGINKLLVGSEILQFETATLTSANTYTISNLRRGQRGTETLTNHAAGERVILLTGNDATIEKLSYTENDIGQTRYFKAPSGGQSLDAAPVLTIDVVGNSLKPLAPINPEANLDNGGNIIITWKRRDRHGVNSENPPLSELQEAWEIEVIENNDPVRTINTSVNFFIYRKFQQIADFGSPQFQINLRIYQVSSILGRGYPLVANLNPGFAEIPPTITSFAPYSGKPGDTVNVYGSGLAAVTAINIGTVAQGNLAVVDDEAISFVVAEGTISGLIEVITTAGTAFSNQAYVISNNVAIPIITDTVNISVDTTIDNSHFGKLLLIDTATADVNLTLNSNVTIPNFTFAVQKINPANQVIFLGNVTANNLTEMNQGIRFYKIGNNWYGS